MQLPTSNAVPVLHSRGREVATCVFLNPHRAFRNPVIIALAVVLFSIAAYAGPLEFGTAELDAAMAARNLKWKNKAEISLDPPESFRIEPYSSGGAYISGGDVRGLMYGLLEASEQIRATGRLTKTRGTAGASLRAVRIAVTPDLEQAPEEFWRAYFQMLARNRFNRVHVISPSLTPPYRIEKLLSSIAADYGVDFTLGIETEITGDDLARLLAACPMIRSVAIGSRSASRDAVFAAVRGAGRRIVLDFDGVTTVLGAATGSGVPVMRPSFAWPPSFEIDSEMDASDPNAHSMYHWLWGRLGYDPHTPVAKFAQGKGATEAEITDFEAARDAILQLGAADQAEHGGSDFVASASEAVRNRVERHPSAKFTPREIAGSLEADAAHLESSKNPDLQILARMARAQAMSQREAYQAALTSANASDATDAIPLSPRPKWTHKPPSSATGNQPLELTLKFASPKEIAGAKGVSLVRVHYRTLDPTGVEKNIDMPAAPEMKFQIPAGDLTGSWDLFYYFEILSPSGGGWFEPDPLTNRPYITVPINAPRTGPN